MVEEHKPSVTFEEQPKSDAVVPYKPVGRAIAPPNAAAAKKYSMNAAELWQFKEIVSHQGPLSTEHKDYNGSTYCWR